MAQNFRNDLQSAVGTVAQTLVTGADYDAVIGIRCCNILTSTIEVDAVSYTHLTLPTSDLV